MKQTGKVVELATGSEVSEPVKPVTAMKEISDEINTLVEQIGAMGVDESKEEERTVATERLVFLRALYGYAKLRKTLNSDGHLTPINIKGLRPLMKQLKALLSGAKRYEDWEHIVPEIEANIEHLKRWRAQGQRKASKGFKNKKKEKQTGGNRRVRKHWFKWDGHRLLKPEKIEFFDELLNIVADVDIGNVSLNQEEVQAIADEGNFLCLFRTFNNKDKTVAIVINKQAILTSREQRFQLAHTGGVETVASLFKRDIPELLDKRLKNPEKIVTKHKEDFLSAYGTEIILKDIDRLIKMQ